MDQENFGRLLKSLRKKNHLTQKDLADRYHVTYQAVSKWENGKNMPDTSLINQISKDFNISLEELLDGEYQSKKKNRYRLGIVIVIGTIFLIVLLCIIIFQSFQKEDFQFKIISTNCENFNISGNIAYNDKKSAIYIHNIRYCGGEDREIYKKIECILYETNQDFDKRISSYQYEEKEGFRLEDFLQKVTLTVDHYESTCKEYKDNTLYLSIFATTFNDKVVNYKVPLKLDSSCSID